MCNRVHRKKQHKHIGDHIEGRRSNERLGRVDTCPGERWIPELFARYAGERECKQEGYVAGDVAPEEGLDEPEENAPLIHDEYSLHLQYQSHLGTEHNGTVEAFDDIGKLRGISQQCSA